MRRAGYVCAKEGRSEGRMEDQRGRESEGGRVRKEKEGRTGGEE